MNRSAAERWIELRIGELLGPVTPGERTDLEPVTHATGLSTQERVAFRKMAARRERVGPLTSEAPP